MPKITNEIADALSLAYVHLDEAVDPRTILDILCFNCGLEEFGKPGDPVIYNPLIHEDMHGGLCPGAELVIVHCGWKYEGKTLIRAQVNYPEPHTCKWCTK